MTDEEVRTLDSLVEKVEGEVGMGKGAWDMVDSRELAAAFMKHAPRFIPLKIPIDGHDMLKGPCACGAWHDWEHVEIRIKEARDV